MKISVVSGGFDPIHSGHIEYFKAAKLNSDKLIVFPKNSEKFNFSTRTNIIRKNYQSSRSEIDSAVKWVEVICKQEPYLSSLLEYIE